MNKYRRKLVYNENKHQILAEWLDERKYETNVVLVESVKDCIILNEGQDCRYTLAKAMDPFTHYIMVHPNGCIEFEKREDVSKILTEEV